MNLLIRNRLNSLQSELGEALKLAGKLLHAHRSSVCTSATGARSSRGGLAWVNEERLLNVWGKRRGRIRNLSEKLASLALRMKNLRLGVINEIHKLITQFNNDVITICHFTVQRSEQFSEILFDKTGHNFFWVYVQVRVDI